MNAFVHYNNNLTNKLYILIHEALLFNIATTIKATSAINIIMIMHSMNLSVIMVLPKYLMYFIVLYDVASI